jgi:Uncharacterized conserved protein
MRKASLLVNGVPADLTVEIAETVLQRARGLMGREDLNGGLLIDPCRSIHTFFMRLSIDAVFLDNANRVVRITPEIQPGRIPMPVLSARRVLELPAGSALKLGIKPGDTLAFDR